MKFDVYLKGIGVFLLGFCISLLMGAVISDSSSTTPTPFIAFTWIAIIYLSSVVVICTMLILNKLDKK
jgi:hypothetical protein